MTLPPSFLTRMQALLGTDYPAFFEALGAPSVHALRVNRRKTAQERLLSLLPFSLTPLGFRDAFTLPDESRAGALPHHHAGMYYLQDPSAMAAVEAAAITPGARVLDVCASPGGKSGQLAAAIGEEGVLVSNEIVPSRCRTLLGNIERLGIPNALVMQTDPAGLAALFDRVFDLTLADVPCSGEGMFRKYPNAAAEWSEAGVSHCAARGLHILNTVASTVKEGGYLLFSTCTFSVEENEENVDAFLKAHPEYEPVPVTPAVLAVTAPGVPLSENTRHCRRYYPHLAPGEGQFVALFRRIDGGVGGVSYRDAALPLPKKEAKRLQDALSELMTDTDALRLSVHGDALCARPDFPLPPYALFRAGVMLGELSAKTFLPHHQAISALGGRFRRTLSLAADDPRVAAYLRGEPIPVEEREAAPGFAALLFEGAPLGGVKISNGTAKNHYPKGLRTMG